MLKVVLERCPVSDLKKTEVRLERCPIKDLKIAVLKLARVSIPKNCFNQEQNLTKIKKSRGRPPKSKTCPLIIQDKSRQNRRNKRNISLKVEDDENIDGNDESDKENGNLVHIHSVS